MKKVLGLILASFIGGSFSIIGYLYLNKNNTNNLPADKTNISLQSINNNLTNNRANLDFTDAAEKTVHAVVHVKVRSHKAGYNNTFYNYLFGKPSNPNEPAPIVSTGSGVIISNDGYIVTNNHVIEGAEILEVTLNDKRSLPAKIIGTDPTTDIALIKIEGDDYPFIPWGESNKLKVGEWVLAVGNPFNLTSTVTAGIVSAKARNINIINKRTAIEAFIQTDAAVNPGNSGGALVNTDGKLVGINSAIASPTGSFTGYSFAIPQQIAEKIVGDLLEYGAVQRAFIGVSITDITSTEAKNSGIKSTHGVYVNNVAEGGAAQEAGIKAGDVILSVNDIEVNSTPELQEQVGQYRPGDKVSVKISRGNKEKTILVTLRNINGETSIIKNDDTIEIYGAKIKKVTSSELNKLHIKGGVKVISLSNGKFKSAGIKEGYIITAINNQAIFNMQDLQAVLKSISDGGVYIEGVYPNGISAYYAFGL
jgi:Do/DeqQ family serine protease